MRSASAMSLEIRRKKKEAQNSPELLDLSGEMTDKTDEDTAEQDAMTQELGLEHNTPKQHDEEPSEHEEALTDSHDTEPEEEEPDSKRTRMAKGGKVGEHASNHSYNFDDSQSVKGVNKVLPHYNRETKKLEHGGSESHWGGKNSLETQKKMHRETLEELRSMPKPKLEGLAEGGSVDDMKKRKDHELGVNLETAKQAGHRTKGYRRGMTELAKGVHSNILEELRSMPNPKLKGLAEGGEVDAKAKRRARIAKMMNR